MGESLYDRLGGEMAVMATVRTFYDKVMADPRLSPYFQGLDMAAQVKKQVAFMTMAFGGPHDYTGRDMQTAHARLVQQGMGDAQFDAVLVHIEDTLRELGVSDREVAEVRSVVESTRNHVLGRAS